MDEQRLIAEVCSKLSRVQVAESCKTDVIDARAAAARIRQELSGRKHSDSAVLIAEDRRRA